MQRINPTKPVFIETQGSKVLYELLCDKLQSLGLTRTAASPQTPELIEADFENRRFLDTGKGRTQEISAEAVNGSDIQFGISGNRTRRPDQDNG